MTKITKQLETLTPEELLYIYNNLSEFNERVTAERAKTKLIMSFMKDITDLANAHFDGDSDFDVKVLDLKEDNEIQEMAAKVDKSIEMTGNIIKKLKPLIDSL